MKFLSFFQGASAAFLLWSCSAEVSQELSSSQGLRGLSSERVNADKVLTQVKSAAVTADATTPHENQRTLEDPSGYFKKPKWNGRRVDWCLVFAFACGEYAANDFCRMQGYKEASSWEEDENIGDTVLLGSAANCQLAFCDGFESITCSVSQYQPKQKGCDGASVEFAFPTYMGEETLLDWCLTLRFNCGKQAADSFCRMKCGSYGRAIDYKKNRDTDYKTKTIGTGETCHPNQQRCDSFKSITCHCSSEEC
jgi:hypothetical protein